MSDLVQNCVRNSSSIPQKLDHRSGAKSQSVHVIDSHDIDLTIVSLFSRILLYISGFRLSQLIVTVLGLIFTKFCDFLLRFEQINLDLVLSLDLLTLSFLLRFGFAYVSSRILLVILV